MATLSPAKKRASAGGSPDTEPKRSPSDVKTPGPPDVEVSRSAAPANEMAVEMSRPAVVGQSLGDTSISADVKTSAHSGSAANELKDRQRPRSGPEIAPPVAPAMQEIARATSDPLDQLFHAREARFTGSLSPVSLTLAYLDWAFHLANAPGRQLELAREAGRQWARLSSPGHWTTPARGDQRFSDPAWSQLPFNVISQTFLLAEEWWRDVTLGPPGVAKSHCDAVAFGARQILDVFSPSNFVATNPEVLAATARSSAGISLRASRIS